MKKERTWEEKYRTKMNWVRVRILFDFFIPLALAFLFGFMAGPVDLSVPSTNRDLAITSLVFSGISAMMLIYVWVALFHTRIDVDVYKGNSIMAYVLNKKCKLIIEGREAEVLHRLNYRDFVILTGYLDDETKVECKISGIESHFFYTEKAVTNNVTVNKYSRKSQKKDELTPIQKKLVEQAKTDTLASIDPNNPEDTKKKLDIYNKLDKLDD